MRTISLRPNLVLLLACTLTLLLFLVDIAVPDSHFWGRYLLPILVVFLWGRRRDIFVVTALACALVVGDYWLDGAGRRQRSPHESRAAGCGAAADRLGARPTPARPGPPAHPARRAPPAPAGNGTAGRRPHHRAANRFRRPPPLAGTARQAFPRQPRRHRHLPRFRRLLP